MSTEEQTMALKGILGIGSPTTGKTSTSNTTPSSKKKTKKKKKDSSTGSEKKTNKNSNANKNSNKNNGNSTTGKNKANNKKEQQMRKKIEKKDSMNYAWSAFQSAPDASTLPLPAFGSADFEDGFNQPIAASDEKEQEQTVEETKTAVTNANDIKKILNIPLAEEDSPEKEKKNSVSGVNLAALALDEKSEPVETAPVITTPKKAEEPVDPLAALMNPSYGNSANRHQNQMQGPYQNHPAMQSPYGMHSPPMTPTQYAGPPQMMSPQPYITIQAQVPSQLLPGRQMTVPVAPGYNVPVVVPEGVQPGMVIPVTVPNVYAQNPMMMSGGYGGMQQMGRPMQNMQQPQAASYQSPMMKKESKPAPGSWAAKAAAKPVPANAGTEGK